jgi:hypothetical protein
MLTKPSYPLSWTEEESQGSQVQHQPSHHIRFHRLEKQVKTRYLKGFDVMREGAGSDHR